MSSYQDYFSVKKSSIGEYQGRYSSSQWGVLAVFDYNHDKKLDFLVHAIHYDSEQPNSSLPILFMKGNGDGTFSLDQYATSGGNPNVFDARTAVGDFNGDGYNDIILIDSGSTLGGNLTYKGNQTYFLAGQASGSFNVQTIPGATWYAKNLSVLDINQDKKLDIFVESNGESGKSLTLTNPPHFLINDGKGHFNVDNSRLPVQTTIANWATTFSDYYSQTPDSQQNRYLGESFADFNNDGFPDIVFPSLDGPTTNPKATERFSKMILNDQTGNFPLQNQISLSEPLWNGGLLSAQDSVSGDIDNDGYQDLIIGWTSLDYAGRYLQVFRNLGTGAFKDVTESVIGSQSLERQQIDLDGERNSNIRFQYRNLELVDFNGDGWLDIFIGSTADISPNAPILYLNDTHGNFQTFDISALGYQSYFEPNRGRSQFLIDANSDGMLDIGFIDSNGLGLEFDVFVNKINPVKINTLLITGASTKYSINTNNVGLMSVTEVVDSSQEWQKSWNLSNIDRLLFSDVSVALDLNGNAGKVAKVLSAVFGSDSVSNAEYVGIGLDLLDGGMSYTDLAALAVSVTGKSSSTDVCNLLWENVIGTAATATDIAPFKAMLDSGQMSIGSLTALAADSTLNTDNIDLVGLSQTGLEYV